MRKNSSKLKSAWNREAKQQQFERSLDEREAAQKRYEANQKERKSNLMQYF